MALMFSNFPTKTLKLFDFRFSSALTSAEGEDDGRRIRVNVGSGFSDINRDEFWLGRGGIVGHVAEVRADAVTQNQDGSFSLRFPRFLRFRGFAPAEKI